MTDIARRRAAGSGQHAIRARVVDLERIDEPDASFDVLPVGEDLMLVADPARAAREIRRVLCPGGRLFVSVSGPRARDPWLGVVVDVVGAQLGATMPPPGMLQPFSLGDRVRLAGVLRTAGLAYVGVSELLTPFCAATATEWWARSAAHRTAGRPPACARSRTARAGSPGHQQYRTPTALLIPGVSLIASARQEAA
jgi:SAM-dependent methyltransferase